MIETSWVCYYFYYQGDFDLLINHLVRHIFFKLNKVVNLEKYFFIRYWEGGPHLRFRVLIPKSQVQSVKNTIIDCFELFIDHYPSQNLFETNVPFFREAMKNLAKLEGGSVHSNEILNNIIREGVYEPEWVKYQGEIGVNIAEAVFTKSSSITLEVLKSPENFSKKSRFVLAFVFMLVAVKAFEFTIAQAHYFFSKYHEYWLHYTEMRYQCSLDKETDEFQLKNERYFCKLFDKFYNLIEIENSVFEEWYTMLNAARYRLQRELSCDHKTLAGLLTQYIHTHNNRLGIQVSEEAVLGNVLSKTAKLMMVGSE